MKRVISLVKFEGRHFILLDRETNIPVCNTVETAVILWKMQADLWQEFHSLLKEIGTEEDFANFSVSETFAPVVVELEELEVEELLGEPPWKVFILREGHTHVNGMLCETEKVVEVYNNGVNPFKEVVH